MQKAMRAWLAGVATAGLWAAPVQAVTTDKPEKEGSLYLQCDGQPNNMTGGEQAARIVGAITLLGLFAPPPEAPDASKRKKGAAGVEACTALIDGAKKEGNPRRRVQLILGRAIHRLEAKDYPAAIADAQFARHEAETAGLMADPYYARSQGRASDLVEAAALYRMGKPEEARTAVLRPAPALDHSFFGLATLPAVLMQSPTDLAAERAFLSERTRSAAIFASFEADRLEELGQFGPAAKLRDALVDFGRGSGSELIASDWLARAAVTHALAGDREVAAASAAAARANFEKRKADGKPEDNPARYVELMDLYTVLDTAAGGDVKGARRLFAARSQWVEAPFGAVVETNRRLRRGAAADELIGGLAQTPEAMWEARTSAASAAMLAKDDDNRSLFWLIPAAESAAAYEAVSKKVWKTDKSPMLLAPKSGEEKKSKLETLFLFGVSPDVAMQAYTMHAALLARQRGQQGFVITPLFVRGLSAAMILTGNRDDPGLPGAMFNDAATVIADLSPIFPSPDALKARKQTADRH